MCQKPCDMSRVANEEKKVGKQSGIYCNIAFLVSVLLLSHIA